MHNGKKEGELKELAIFRARLVAGNIFAAGISLSLAGSGAFGFVSQTGKEPELQEHKNKD